MALFDSMSKGASFIDQLQRGRILDAQARYAEPTARENFYGLKTRNKYLDPMLAAKLYDTQTRNKYLDPELAAALYEHQTNNKYLDEKNRLGNQFQGLANAHQGQVNEFYPEITRGQIDKQNIENKYAPLDMAVKTQNALRLSSRFGDAFALKQELSNMPKASRDAWIADHHDEYVGMVNTIANAANQPQQNFLQGFANKYFPGAGEGSSGNQQMPAQGLGAPMMGQQQPSATFSSTPESLQRGKLAAEMSANNDLLTQKTRSQAAAATNLDNWLSTNQPEYSKRINNISRYANAIGKGRLTVDKLKSKNPEAYQDFQWFNNTFKNNVDALLTQMEGLSINEGQQKRLIELSTGAFNNLTTDPESAIKQFNSFIKMTKEIGKQRVATAQPLYKDTYKDAYNFDEKNQPYVQEKSKPSYDASQLQKMAQEAIAKGADPKAVEARMKELMNG